MHDLRWLSFVNHVGIWSHFSDSMLWGHSEEECSALWIGFHAVSDLLNTTVVLRTDSVSDTCKLFYVLVFTSVTAKKYRPSDCVKDKAMPWHMKYLRPFGGGKLVFPFPSTGVKNSRSQIKAKILIETTHLTEARGNLLTMVHYHYMIKRG